VDSETGPVERLAEEGRHLGERSDFARRPQDSYETPSEAVGPLLPHLPTRTTFLAPCAGAGKLVGHLTRAGHVCVSSSDLPIDARSHRYDTSGADCFLPRWSSPILHEIIVNLSDQLPTWLLVDYDWAATLQSVPYLPRLRKLVAIGRVRWIEGSPHDGKDDACWLLFDRPAGVPTVFIGRVQERRTRP
jgi:hypothetical protein